MLQKEERKGALHRMKINEVEQQVGITKKNIRFYEQQGLLHPKRNSENGYREYDETDVECLKKIKLLRKLSLPIEEIKKIQNGDLLLTDALRRQLIVLEREQTNLTETAGLCRLILEDETLYHTLSPDQYLERMVEMEEKGTRFKNVSNDTIRKKRGSILAAVIFILIMFAFIGILVWAYTQDPIPNILFGLFLLVPIIVILAVIIALLQRIKELKGGEEDVARKY
ncbi:MAG: MerR family transcriptional regulator [Lachnospiraceae bacterium]|nr:MerR family transcriptional regulator [Lachnospiraceae bacterium]